MKWCYRCRKEYRADKWCSCSGRNIWQTLIDAVAESILQETQGGRPQK